MLRSILDLELPQVSRDPRLRHIDDDPRRKLDLVWNFTPIFFGETILGAKMPSLTYMCTFADMVARDRVDFAIATGSEDLFPHLVRLPSFL